MKTCGGRRTYQTPTPEPEVGPLVVGLALDGLMTYPHVIWCGDTVCPLVRV